MRPFRKLYIVLQRESLRDQVVIDQVENTPGKQLYGHIEVAGVSGAQHQRILRESGLGYPCNGGGENCILRFLERRRVGMVYGEVGSSKP